MDTSYTVGQGQDLSDPLNEKRVEFDEWADEEEDDATGGSSMSKTSVAGAVISFVCTTVGTGILALPSAIALIGWTGVILIFFITIICRHTANYLVACQFSCPPRSLHTYEDIGEAALGIFGRRLVATCQCVSLMGISAIFLVLIGHNLNALIPSVGYHVWVLVFGAALIPFSWIKRMREIAILAYFGLCASLFVAIVVIIKGGMNGYNESHHANSSNNNSIHYDVFRISGLSQGFNLIVFSFGGHSVLPGIIAEMKKPYSNYKKMTRWSYIIIALVYSTVAAAGYAGFGDQCKDNILMNFNSDSIIIKASIAIITAHIIFAYPIPLNPVALYTEELLQINSSRLGPTKEWIYRVIWRTCLVILTMLIATCIPYFGDMLSLVSALTIIAVAFIFPPLFYYLLYRRVYEFSIWHKLLMIFIVFIGVLGTVAGLYFSIQQLISDSKQNPFANFWNQ